MHYVGFVDPDDMNVVSGKRKFTSLVGYSGSKLAQVMFSNVLLKRLPLETRISVVCLSPGIVLTNVVSITLSLTPLLVLHNLYHIKPF
jgi:NAD(P)-dependent dehydrogenase (short-subunit alcohol dehydrogenase family)